MIASMRRALPLGLALSLAGLLAPLTAAAAAHTVRLHGTITARSYTFAAGSTYLITAPLTLRAKGGVTVRGRIQLANGASLTVTAGGSIVVAAPIASAPGARAACAGASVTLTAARVTISAPVTGAPGATGRDGIGCPGGRVAVTADTVTVTAAIHAGTGGAGAMVRRTVGTTSACHAPNTIATRASVIIAGAGGAGGAVKVTERRRGANDAHLATFLRGGDGGAGGTIGSFAAPSGTAGRGGGSLYATLGRGGDGGAATLLGGPATASTRTSGAPGTGGSQSSASLHPGEGGPDCDGGTAVVLAARSGAGGAPAPATLALSGGNGGASTDPSTPGGNGGTFVLSGADPGAGGQWVAPRLAATDAFNGGTGYDGCTRPTHAGGGTGGMGGRWVLFFDALPALGSFVHAGDGGKAGDGDGPGTPGPPGYFGAPMPGALGRPCATSFSVAFPTPATTEAGTAREVTVTATEHGAVDTTYVGQVALTTSDHAGVLPAAYTFTRADAGVHTFLVTLVTAPGATVTATDSGPGGPTGTSLLTPVTPSEIATFTATPPPGVVAGTRFSLDTVALDRFGNEVPGARPMAFSTNDPQGTVPPGDLPPYYVTLRTSGQETITLVDPGTGVSGTVTVNVTPAAPAALSVTPSVTPVPFGSQVTIRVASIDAFGNETGTFTGHFKVSTTDTTAADVIGLAADGVGTASMSFGTPGPQTVTATEQVPAGRTPLTGSTSIVVQPGPTTRLVLSAPSTVTAGSGFSLTISAEDDWGNVTPAYAGTVYLTSSDPQLVRLPAITFTAGDAGVHGVTVEERTAGAQTLTATDTVISSLHGSTPTTVQPGPTTRLALNASGVNTGFTPVTVYVTARDGYGNATPAYAGTVHFGSSNPNDNLPVDYTFVSGDAGVHAFDIFLFPGTTLTATDIADSSISGSVSV
jgi:hypothetical protein